MIFVQGKSYGTAAVCLMLCYVAGDIKYITVLKQAIGSAIDKLEIFNSVHYISNAKWLYIIIACRHVRYDGNSIKIRFTAKHCGQHCHKILIGLTNFSSWLFYNAKKRS